MKQLLISYFVTNFGFLVVSALAETPLNTWKKGTMLLDRLQTSPDETDADIANFIKEVLEDQHQKVFFSLLV